MLEVAEAYARMTAHCQRLKPEITALTTSALGQVLADDIIADIDSPPFAKAMMDGYAVRSTDHGERTVVEEVAAGMMASRPLAQGEAMRIFTGALMPEGSDAVVMQEKCEVTDMTLSFDDNGVSPNLNVLQQGDEMRMGDIAVPAGSIINPSRFGIFAAAGKTAVTAYPAPSMSVIITGNELVEANSQLMAGQIRNTNGPMLVAQAVRAGALPRYLGIGRDDKKVLTSLIREGLTTTKCVVLSGGVSVGKHDLVPEVLRELGVEIVFQKVRMKPGKPLLFGVKNDVLVFGLPGNPVSAFVGFELFVRPALRILAGQAEPGPLRTKLPLSEALKVSHNRPTFAPAKRVVTANGFAVQPLPWIGSADLRALGDADCLLALPEGDHALEMGAMVEVVVLS